MFLVFFVMPVALYLALCLLPRGQPAALGVGAAALALLAFTLTAPEGEEGEFRMTLAAIAGIGVALAGIAQAVRVRVLPERPGRLWPVLVLGELALALMVFLLLLGV